MQQGFLLLRDNKQTGPLSLDELVKTGLKKDDLIWIEGRSAAWSFPYEIDVLKSYVQAPIPAEENANSKSTSERKYKRESSLPSEIVAAAKKIAVSKKVHVSLPENKSSSLQREQPTQNDLFEQKAEELRKRAQNFASTKDSRLDDLVETKYQRSLNDVEEDYTSWVFEKKSNQKKLSSKKKAVIALSLFGVLIVSFFVFKSFSNEDQVFAKNNAIVETPEQLANDPSADTSNVAVATIAKENEDDRQNIILEPPVKQSKTSQTPPILQKTKRQTVVTTAVETKPVRTETQQQPIAESQITKNEQVVKTETKEKKTLGKKIDGLFEKLKTKKSGDDGSETTVSSPDTEEARNSERREETGKQTTVDLASFAELNSNLKSSSWMMGIKGLKISLRNKGTQTIQSATAEVRYYNDQDELLEKKNIQFSNIPPKKSLAVSAPDHRLADHVDFKLIAASGQTP